MQLYSLQSDATNLCKQDFKHLIGIIVLKNFAETSDQFIGNEQ